MAKVATERMKEFVGKARAIGKGYSSWAHSERCAWLAEEFAGSHTYKGAAIPNFNRIEVLRLRANGIARRADAQQKRLKESCC